MRNPSNNDRRNWLTFALAGFLSFSIMYAYHRLIGGNFGLLFWFFGALPAGTALASLVTGRDLMREITWRPSEPLPPARDRHFSR